MRKVLIVCGLMLISMSFVSKVYSAEVLTGFPIIKPIVWNWANGDYITKNTPEIKQRISNQFVNILCYEENALNDYITDNNVSYADKVWAIENHVNNVEAVSKNLAQVVDWIISYNNAEGMVCPERIVTLETSFYGIKYRFQSELITDEGETFYAFTKVTLVDYPMIEMKLDYVGTELHIVSKLNKEAYRQKFLIK